MRLDKLITECGAASRKEAALAARSGKITVNGIPVTDPGSKVNPACDRVTFCGQALVWREFYYVLLNKPAGYVSATEDSRLPYVLELLSPFLQKRGLFPVGRLDRDTTGLLLMTDDGQSAHRLLSPRRHVEKIYRFTCDPPLPATAEAAFSGGMMIDGGERCKPAVLSASPTRREGTVTLTEGKYHEVKRMFASLGSTVTSLERISFAGIPLDPSLSRGEWRYLTPEEEATLLGAT